MRHAGRPRREIGIRTVFNILGPLTNPAGAKRQLLGVYDARLAPVMAEVAGRLGAERVLVVNGHPGHGRGLRERSDHRRRVRREQRRRVRTYEVDAGVGRARARDARRHRRWRRCRERRRSCARSSAAKAGPRRDVVLHERGGRAARGGDASPTSPRAWPLAREAIDSGRAIAALDALGELSRRLAAQRAERKPVSEATL